METIPAEGPRKQDHGVQLTDLMSFNQRATIVRAKFKEEVGYGGQTEAAHDLRVSASMVSSVLSGKYYDPVLLDRLDVWADRFLAGEIKVTGAVR